MAKSLGHQRMKQANWASNQRKIDTGVSFAHPKEIWELVFRTIARSDKGLILETSVLPLLYNIQITLSIQLAKQNGGNLYLHLYAIGWERQVRYADTFQEYGVFVTILWKNIHRLICSWFRLADMSGFTGGPLFVEMERATVLRDWCLQGKVT